ncbi:MAG TPA: glycosyltransferase family 4 protein [Candidatus Binataceae bacterium]|nr:glycosyltransferase family 4 protein [Candidatus Binataceae bacterium]
MIWRLITGEYPPRIGGVADYTRLVASGLAAAGDEVHVWAPPPVGTEHDPGVTVRRLPSHFGPRSLAALNREIARRPGHVLVQYVPHAFGLKAMNLPFCAWLYSIRRRGVIVMFHEVNFPFGRGQRLRHNALGLVTRAMAALAARSARRIFVATPAWEPHLRPYLPRESAIDWLPVPSNIPPLFDRAGLAAVRLRYSRGDGLILGHFGAYGCETARALTSFLPALMREHPRLSVLLAGKGSIEFRDRLLPRLSDMAARIHATGAMTVAELSPVLAACDVAAQPFADGVSARRCSAMAFLAHGVPVATNSGAATEPIWVESKAVALAPGDDYKAMGRLVARMLADPGLRADYSARARELYARRFDLSHTIAALRSI